MSVFQLRIEVTPAVIDPNGHVNNVAYVQWMQDIAFAHFESLGGVPMLDQFNATWFARSHQINYLRPAHLGEVILAETWIATVERVSSTRKYSFARDGKYLAEGETEWVFVDRTNGKPKRIPDEMIEILKGLPPSPFGRGPG